MPTIFVTNDDGIHAPGIYALWDAVQSLGNVIVVAPNTEKSAVGHAITIADPIRVEPLNRTNGFQGFAVNGTPADCVKIGVQALMDTKPDIIVSGINMGSNTGNNVIYSGTVSAATEGTILNIPSIAFSLDVLREGDFTYAKIVAQKVVSRVMETGLPQGTLLNVNIPGIPEVEIKGTKITRQGNVYFRDHFEKREDPRGRIYYWMTGNLEDPDTDSDLDGQAVKDGFVSITPIRHDLTDESYLPTLQNWNLE
ncbi:MAG: 5'/3'-nucleotidase SurE [Candidatus Marinimicrobia bacterium]|uniref:5'-nucleotidase SurE n=1 Tax=uncultured bacterium FGYC_13M19 TaxID=1343844 RepID=S4W7I2_9BACT|nr:stationary phase survival protein SurE [uncultured bacterium FGYC_13M19]MBT3217406.1 5'/3'-nucleotidase SurE [Candidatus Neomarinimicrobiota bacterium]MBT3618692.1 5'/3'-nucleotidase SurE [Candidatus Neomarinimicrobiota bacterium]MBT3828558.1 5'/3'-nucleotidase SurE [Candidatus Neomarinimicrobiota bacterium]MBT3996712.1 5'/3'-nucleotidase SurE [Candidatus Neomarinimicrobiota bacterium]